MAGTDAEAFACAAEGLIGTSFRLHGRDPASGLDCIGLVFASLVAIGRDPVAPRGYALRNLSIAQWLGCAEGSGLADATGTLVRGDVLLMQPSRVQTHLMIVCDARQVVHAHALLRRIVRQPIPAEMQPRAHWRLAPSA